jgi:hypothetical protein
MEVCFMTQSMVFRILATAGVVTLYASPLMASKFIPVSVPDRIRGAERVVVATVSQVETSLETNEQGDQVIVSHFILLVDEALKGGAERRVSLDMEGGTYGDLTMEVSSLPKLAIGERGIFFLKRGTTAYRPHLAGQGIIKLQHDDTVKNSSLTLEAVRQMAADAGR